MTDCSSDVFDAQKSHYERRDFHQAHQRNVDVKVAAECLDTQRYAVVQQSNCKPG